MSDETDDAIERLLQSFWEDHESHVKAALDAIGVDEKTLQDSCPHAKCMPAFDAEEARKIGDAWEIRRRFPRFMGLCPDCGVNLISYASYEHYLMGDW